MSRRRVGAFLAAASTVGLATALGWSFQRPTSVTQNEVHAPPYAFDLCILRSPPAPSAHLSWNEAVLSGVARALVPAERESLEAALDVAATRWEARANPLLEDLEGGDPEASLVTWFKTAPPFVRTAYASARLRACTPDGFCVIPRALGAGCPNDSAPPTSANEADRARFILWPWGHALRFKAASPVLAQASAAALREGVRSSRTVAVVLTADDAELPNGAPLAKTRERWRRVGALSRIAQRELPRAGDPTFTIEQRSDEVIVLPRFEAIADGDPDARIEADVRASAPQLHRRER